MQFVSAAQLFLLIKLRNIQTYLQLQIRTLHLPDAGSPIAELPIGSYGLIIQFLQHGELELGSQL